MAVTRKQLKSQLANATNRAKNARDKLTLEMSFNRNKGLPEKSGAAYEAADAAFKAAGEEVEKARNALENFKEPEKKKTPKQIADEEEKLRQDDIIAGKDPVVEAAKRREIADQKKNATGQEGSDTSARDIDKEIIAAPKFIYNKSDPEKKAFANELTSAGYKVINWRDPEELVGKYQEALSDNKKRNTSFGINQTLDEFISTKVSEQAGTGGGTRTEIDVTVSSPTQAASTIQSVVRGILNRDATPEEIEKLYKVLNKAERSAGRKAVRVGNRTEYTTDLDRVQFLTEEVKKIKDPKTGKSEFETKRGQKESLASQELMSVARANGITLSQNQIDSYANDIRNGKDINVIKNDIRSTAGLGRPDNIKKLLAEGTDLETVYAPYKRTMATLLELDPNSIDLNDTTLQTAIGDKELPIYEFRRLLKKDPRWQYTNNAREEVSNKVLRVLQDFGFQG
jgi:hypothetical protein